MNTSYVQGQTAQTGGEIKINMLTATGPASYSPTAGDVVYNPGSCDYIEFPMDCTSQSGNYKVRFVPTTAGTLRAGAPSPSQSGWTAYWEYAGSTNQPDVGTPITLGPLSVAGTTSAMTANGVFTGVVTNTLKAGQFVVISSGGSGVSIFLNGQILQVVTASATQFTANFGMAGTNGNSLNYVSAADTFKFQVVQTQAGSPVALGTGTGQVATCTGFLATAQLLTVTAANTFQAGQFVVIQGAVAGEIVQGAIVQIKSATSSAFTAFWQGAVLNQTSGETATATLLVTSGNAPVALTQFTPVTNSVATAANATTTGVITLTSTQAFFPGQLVVPQGLASGTILDGTIATVIATNLAPTVFTTNAFTAAFSTHSEATGGVAALVAGVPASGNFVASGTNLAGESVQFGALISQI
jgi:hypothetical protein